MANFRTPLRYPGGKQKLSPFILEVIKTNNLQNVHYVEPYAGGAGVGIDLLLSNQVDHIHLNDSNLGIYAFWYSVLNHTQKFCKLIVSASLNIEEWKRRREIVRNPSKHSLLQLGFSIFYLNRCNRSGVITGGVIGGLEQKGKWKMDARFTRNDLIRRVEAIAARKKNISISNFDAEYYIQNYLPNLPESTLIYFDPPYFEKSSNLYLDTYNKEDHKVLAKTIQSEVTHKWILSYDGVTEILELYKKRRYFLYNLQYTAANVYKGQEVFIFCDNLEIPSTSKLAFIDEKVRLLSV